MLYFILEKVKTRDFPKRQTPSNRETQSQWVLTKSQGSQVAEENKSLIDPKALPLGFLFGSSKMRETRVYLKGAVCYTTVKANAGELLFREEADYIYFLELLKKRKRKYNFKLYAFCLLPRHYHLLIETKDKNISKIMQAINTSYSLYFNKKYNRQGHLLSGRFKMKVVNKDASLLVLTYHIHLNPKRCGMAKMPDEYRFSSYAEYTKDTGAPSLTEVLEILSYLGSEDKSALRRRYKELTEEQAQKEPILQIKEEETTILEGEEIIKKKIFAPKILVGIGSGLAVALIVFLFIGMPFQPKPRGSQLRETFATRIKGGPNINISMISLPDGLPQVEDNQAKKQVWELWKN